MSAVTRVEGAAFRLPLRGALRWGATSQLSAAEGVQVRVTLADGSVGVAEALPRPTIYGETLESIHGALRLLDAALRGVDAFDETGVARALRAITHNHTARGALDMALWEARAASRGSSLPELLGVTRARVRVSYILGIGTPETMLEEARRVVAAGVRVLKVKVGRDHARDLEVVRALRTELPEVDLYADANETLTPESAPAALAAMRAAGLRWVEEPIAVHRLRERAELRRLGILPIIADDSCFTPEALERELDFDTFDILNVKAARTGFTDSLRMIARAREAGKSVMVGSQAANLLGTRHAALLAARAEVELPSELSFFLKLQDDIAGPAPALQDGWLNLEDLRAVRLDEARLERYRV